MATYSASGIPTRGDRLRALEEQFETTPEGLPDLEIWAYRALGWLGQSVLSMFMLTVWRQQRWISQEIQKQVHWASVQSLAYARFAAGLETPGGMSWSDSSGDNNLSSSAFADDLHILQQEFRQRRGLLGNAVDPRDWGPFGALWPSGSPMWYREKVGGLEVSHPEPVIVPGDESGLPALTEIGQVDIVCWHVPLRGRRARVHDLILQIGQIAATSARKHVAPPVFLVHAPDIEAELCNSILAAGAKLLTDAKVGNKTPKDSEELSDALRISLRAGFRANWTAAPATRTSETRARSSARVTTVSQAIANGGWDRDLEIKGTEQDYTEFPV